MPSVFETITLRETTFKNRMWLSPMCTYSALAEQPGQVTDFHVEHLSSRARGGAGLVMVEATAVSPEGRISPYDLGLWGEEHIAPMARITEAVHGYEAKAGVQLAHAGRKASTDKPQNGGAPLDAEQGGWQSVGASPIAFPGYPIPHELEQSEMQEVIDDFVSATRRAEQAGFDVVEIHASHGYLLHSFLSPLSNKRSDDYGGSLQNRMRFPLQVLGAVRESFPESKPVFVRISTTDWVSDEPSWDIAQSVEFAKAAKKLGVDLVDCSSGGLVPTPIPDEVAYQTTLATQLHAEADIAVAGVGRITSGAQAQELISAGDVDAVFIGRAMLSDAEFAIKELSGIYQEPVELSQA